MHQSRIDVKIYMNSLYFGSQHFRKQPRLASLKDLEDSMEEVQSGCIQKCPYQNDTYVFRRLDTTYVVCFGSHEGIRPSRFAPNFMRPRSRDGIQNMRLTYSDVTQKQRQKKSSVSIYQGGPQARSYHENRRFNLIPTISG